MATPAILGSVQCLQLAKNYAELGRHEEAAMVLRKIVAAHPAQGEATQLLARLSGGTAAISPVKPVGRNEPVSMRQRQAVQGVSRPVSGCA